MSGCGSGFLDTGEGFIVYATTCRLHPSLSLSISPSECNLFVGRIMVLTSPNKSTTYTILLDFGHRNLISVSRVRSYVEHPPTDPSSWSLGGSDVVEAMALLGASICPAADLASWTPARV